HRLVPALIGTTVAPPLSVFVVVHSLPLFAVQFFVTWVGLAGSSIVIMTAMTSMLPNDLRDTAAGTYALVNTLVGFGLGQTLVPFVAGWLGGGSSLGPAILAMIVPGLLLAVVALAIGCRTTGLDAVPLGGGR
ncbi:MAG TPA: hypothetical protein VKS60_06665, partial [Stellaceae bacterium]|nr:hypothetical protein [Stellaceae bacterium]